MAFVVRINGEPVGLLESARDRADVSGVMTLESVESIFLEFVETDQEDPAGRWRIGVTGDELIFQRSIGEGSWANPVTLFSLVAQDQDDSVGSHGVGTLLLNGDGWAQLFDQLIFLVESGSPAGIRFLQLIRTALVLA